LKVKRLAYLAYFKFEVQGSGVSACWPCLRLASCALCHAKEDKNHILYAIDGLIKSVKLKNIAAL